MLRRFEVDLLCGKLSDVMVRTAVAKIDAD